MIAPVVSPEIVAALPHAVLADVRWYLDGRDGRDAFERAHVPGAVWVDLDRQLAAHDQPATEGRHPLPSPVEFAASMAELGIGDDTVVVAYDDTGGLPAGRLVVMLRMLGREAALLDGGLKAWALAGFDIETGPCDPPVPAVFTPQPWPAHRLVTAAEMAAFAERCGFVFVAHAPGNANRSGRVERPFDYIENNFLAGRTFTDAGDLNRQARQWCPTGKAKPNKTPGNDGPHKLCAADGGKATPVAGGDAMGSSASNTAGTLVRGIDPKTICDVIDLEKNIEAFTEMQARLAEQSKGLSPEMLTKFMSLQSPMLQGMMGNYADQSRGMFEQMQKQAEQMFGAFGLKR